MKIKEIIKEGIIPHDFVKEADEDFDLNNNYEAHHFSEKNRDYYRENFSEFYKSGQVPVFERPETSEDPKFSNKPEADYGSAGSRGIEMIRQRIKR